MAPHLVGVSRGQQEQVVFWSSLFCTLRKDVASAHAAWTKWNINTPTCRVYNQHATKAGATMGNCNFVLRCSGVYLTQLGCFGRQTDNMIPSIRWANQAELFGADTFDWLKPASTFNLLWNVLVFSPQESENLEKENAALRKEVKKLSEEAKYLASVLSNHEPLCTGLTPQNPELLFPPHHGSYHHQHITLPHYQHWPVKLRSDARDALATGD